jgi:hypothetical protein
MSAQAVAKNPHIFCSLVGHDDIAAKKESPEEVTARITDCFMQASRASTLMAKREIYNTAFLALKDSFCPQLRPTLFQLLEKYAKETCYAQVSEERNATGESVDDELGFRMCARLMELSFCMQMEDLGFQKCEYDWFQHPSLEALTEDLQIGKDQKGLLFDSLDQALLDVDVLVSKAHEAGLRDIMAQTLLDMTYSYQNITSLCDGAQYRLHRKLQDWTEALIGKETVVQRQQLAEYLYNRCGFMLEMQNASWDELVLGYDSILHVFKECFPQGGSQLIKKEAQINNIQGCIVARSDQKDAKVIAQKYFQRAYELYASIPCDKFLVGNVLTGLISCLVSTPLDQQSASSLLNYSVRLRSIVEEFREEGNHHCYVEEYPKSLQEANEALKKYDDGNK